MTKHDTGVPSPRPRWRRGPVRLVAALVPTLVLLAAAEGLARWAGVSDTRPGDATSMSGVFTPDPVLGWRLKPGAGLISRPVRPGDPPPEGGERGAFSESIGPEGFRDDALVEPRPPGRFRVICLGDSSVFGEGVARAETFPSQLEASLNASSTDGLSVEVLNAGVPGYSTWQSLEQLSRLADHATFDGIVVYNMNSDLGAAVAITDDAWFRRRAPLYRLLWGSAAFRWLDDRLSPPQNLSSSLSIAPNPALGARVTPGQYRENLGRLVDLAADHHAWTVFVVPPVSQDMDGPGTPRQWQPYVVEDAAAAARLDAALAPFLAGGPLVHRDHYRAAMGLVAWERGVPMVDAPPLFKAAWRERPDALRTTDKLLLDQMHPAPEGDRILAAAIKPHVGVRIGIP